MPDKIQKEIPKTPPPDNAAVFDRIVDILSPKGRELVRQSLQAGTSNQGGAAQTASGMALRERKRQLDEWKRAGLFPVLVFLAASCTSEGPVSESVTSDDQLARPDYIDELFRRVSPDEPEDLMSHEGQLHMQTLAAVGREDRHAEVAGTWIVAGPCEPADEREGEVIGMIAGLAADTRIVVINEAHDRPHHREFTRKLATRLAPLGYSHFAAEAFDPAALEIGQLPYAPTNLGTYVNEPVFGSLVRTVKDLGLVLVAYDARISDVEAELEASERVRRREERQAKHLAEVFAKLPEADRMLIHVGYSHAAEVPVRGFDGNPLEWMTARLKRLTGIDPLTIDQTDCVSDSGSIRLTAPSPRHVEGQYDLVVAHPDLAFADGRPAWRAEGAVAKVEIPGGLIRRSTRTIVEARLVDEPLDAVPVDRVMLWPGESIPLLLPAGSYLIVGFHEGSDNLMSVTSQVSVE